ncbi:Cotton fiber protein [Hirschfeldia incana]|nr:Cotton fiber protein [Hirschfeldia incana]
MDVKNLINGGEEEIKNKMKKKRTRGAMHVVGVVLYMLRRRRRTKPFKNGFWRRVAESFQQLKSDNSIMQPPSNITIMPPTSPVKEKPQVRSDDQLSEMVEVFTATSSSCSSGISGYGSAKSLRDIDCLDEDDDNDEDCYGGVDGGDEMIDVKAEEFIERFYEQMRMQNQAYTGRCKAKGMMTV